MNATENKKGRQTKAVKDDTNESLSSYLDLRDECPAQRETL